MPTVRFRQHITTAPVRRPAQAPVRQIEALPISQPPLLLTPPLPPGYTEASIAARRYSRSYTRLSRSMKNAYGPIPRDIPPEYLHTFAPTREAITEPIIIEDERTPSSSAGETLRTPTAGRSGNTTIITAICLVLAIVVIGSWLGSLFVSSTLPRPTASQTITRVNQLDPSQYESTAQYSLWSYSACSAAAMTEVINAYGHDYRLADILKIEANLKQITPDLGLLYGATSIARTVAQFDFSTHALTMPSLDDVLNLANAGTPVIVGWPPDRWQGGHVLVVRGGDAHTVDLVDSSKLNMQSMPRTTFLKYWVGFAVVVTPNNTTASVVPATNYSVLGPPSISPDTINQVLAHYHSPASGKGQALYDLGVKYGVDPAFALAFFMNESSFGTAGEATATLALGNERCISDRPCIDQDRGGYAQFYSWEDGFEHWYMLISGPLYKGAGFTTVDTIIPRYAPNSDHNNEAHYIAIVEHAVDTWRAGKVVVA